MSSEEPDLVVPRRDDLIDRTADVPRPDLAATPSIHLTQFEAREGAVLSYTAACFRSATPGWNGDLDEIVERKLADVAIGMGARLAKRPGMDVTATTRDGGVAHQTLRGEELDGATWLAFRGGAPVACVAACRARGASDDGDHSVCTSFLAGATLRVPLDSAPPPEGVTLGSLRAMVHHPSGSAAAFGALLVVIAALATLRRPKRRRRTHF